MLFLGGGDRRPEGRELLDFAVEGVGVPEDRLGSQAEFCRFQAFLAEPVEWSTVMDRFPVGLIEGMALDSFAAE